MRRLVDVGGALLGLLVLAPLLAAIALAVALGDGGPAIYRQWRVGRGGRPFRMWKFRTMVRDADRRGPALTVAGDRRVTRVGRWLRRHKLDELPQLVNVLRGEMSLVGPRPEVPHYVACYSPAQRRVLDLRPGITDPASLAYVDEELVLAGEVDPDRAYRERLLPHKIALNLEYAARATTRTDLRLVAATVGRLLRPRRHGRAAGAPWAGARLAAPASRTGGPTAMAPPSRLDALLRHRRLVIVCMLLGVVPVGYVAAFVLRFDLAIPPSSHPVIGATALLLVAIRVLTFWRLRLFRGYWQHFSLHDTLVLLQAATIGTLAFAAVLWGAGLLQRTVPLSVVVLEWLLLIFLVGGIHFAARCVREGQVPLRRPPTGRRTLVVGAGAAAERILRDARGDPRLALQPIGLVDDDETKHRRQLHGVPVLGAVRDLPALVARHQIERIVIAIPSATREQLRRIVEQCVATRVEFRVLRPLAEFVERRGADGPLRQVEVEDLLGRRPVEFDCTALQRAIVGRVVLVTGGAGSIGGELARQIAAFRPAALVLYEQAETPLYYMGLELRRLHPELHVVSVVGDITDEPHVRATFAAHRPHLVFHAAAYKHVPLMEANVMEAVRTNVFGTLIVARAAVEHGAGRVLLLSTDKAVYPSSVMGATKRVAERIVLTLDELRRAGTDFRAVRFGNVLGSHGSVLPLFRRQLRAGGPLTVTDPAVTRYFMTVQEAAQLLLQATVLPEATRRIAMLDMGDPVRIFDLAEKLIRLSGLEPYADVPIQITGLRPGEKLHEDLMSSFEASVPTSAPKIRVIEIGVPTTAEAAQLARLVDRLATALAHGSEVHVLDLLRQLVPECVPPLQAPSVAIPADLPWPSTDPTPGRSGRVGQGAVPEVHVP